MTAPQAAVRTGHPLDPLDAEEIRLASASVLKQCDDLQGASFALAALLEPPTEEVVGFRRGDAFARRALVVVVDRASGATHEIVVRLPGAGAEDARVEARRHVEGVQPPIVIEDFVRATEAVLRDARFVQALRRRGIEDLAQVHVDPLSAGAYPHDPHHHRIVWATPYLRPTPEENPYARPIEHLRAAVDLNSGEVVRVVDEDPIVPLSDADGRYADEASVGGWRRDIKPLVITQPDGPSFTLDHHELAWQRWRLHVALHPVDGLVLSHVRYEDEGVERQIVYRANVSEMVVPYGDPHDGFYWRTYFDAGEYGLGRNTNSLTFGCDCVGAVTYLDATVVDAAGRPRAIPNAICLHEEDAGVLWKHTDYATGRAEVRRSRRLVISHVATVGNYDYGFYWSLYQDGTIEVEVRLTGVVLTRGVTPGQELGHATRLAPDLAAPHHQHLFNVRLDMAVDGFENTVEEHDLVPSDVGPRNPWGQAIELRATTIERESQGCAPSIRRQPGRGRSSTVDAATTSASRSATGSCRSTDPRCWPVPPRASRRGPASRGRTCGSRITHPRSCTRAATIPTSIPVAPDCRSGSRRTASSSTPTSCSGTPSASRTRCAPRTGRSCRPSASASPSGRRGSSPAIPPSTCPRARRPARRA